MRIWLYVSLVSLLVALGGCEVRVKAEINSSESDPYAQHYKHGDDLFYKGTFVVKETVTSIIRWQGVTGPDGTARLYNVLGTDVKFQNEVVGSQLSHEELLTLRRQGYRVIVE